MSTRTPFLLGEPSEEIKAHFASAPWAAKLFQDPQLHAFWFRQIKEGLSTADSFLGKTLATEDTIIASQFFYRNPQPPSQFYEIVTLMKLGSGMNGHVDTAHGGLLSVILDEVIGNAAWYEKPVGKSTMTAYLKVDYKKPLPTPNVIVVRAWLEKIEGRKFWGRGVIEDGVGDVVATGEALFLVVDPLKPRLKL